MRHEPNRAFLKNLSAVTMDRRGAVWRWVACLLVVAGISISEASPGHAQPYDTIFQVMIFFTAAAACLVCS